MPCIQITAAITCGDISLFFFWKFLVKQQRLNVGLTHRLNQAGFSPRVHLIAAWKISEMETFLRDRMFCRRTGEYVPLSLEEHPPSIKYDLAIKVSPAKAIPTVAGCGLRRRFQC